MPKGSRIRSTESLLKQGRGSGVLNEYKPWILIQDVPSLGRRTRVRGIKTARQHDFLSDLETNYFYFLEYSDDVVDIREQYPLLPLEETVAIAQEKGIDHPKHPQTGEYVVMTTDFLITKDNGNDKVNVARTIKPKDDLCNKRIMEKFEIEQIYWDRKGIDWGMVTDKEINKEIGRNISFFHSYYDIDKLDTFQDMNISEIQDIMMAYISRVSDTDGKSIRNISKIFDDDMCLPKGSGITIFKHLLARKIIKVDITKEINIDRPMEVEILESSINKEFNIS